MYGVDLIGTRDLLNFFSMYGPTYVEWIDDSSCNVLFPDEFTVKRLLVQLGEVLSADDVAKVDGAPPPPRAFLVVGAAGGLLQLPRLCVLQAPLTDSACWC